jgi:hypothetical protein
MADRPVGARCRSPGYRCRRHGVGPVGPGPRRVVREGAPAVRPRHRCQPRPGLPHRRHGGRGDQRPRDLPARRPPQGRRPPVLQGGCGREADGDGCRDAGHDGCRPGSRWGRVHAGLPRRSDSCARPRSPRSSRAPTRSSASSSADTSCADRAMAAKARHTVRARSPASAVLVDEVQGLPADARADEPPFEGFTALGRDEASDPGRHGEERKGPAQDATPRGAHGHTRWRGGPPGGAKATTAWMTRMWTGSPAMMSNTIVSHGVRTPARSGRWGVSVTPSRTGPCASDMLGPCAA